ncbi:MAG: RNA polymerase sigma-70 factor [Prolixibacteraceae bacterium]
MKQNDKHEGQLIADLKKGDTSAFETIFRLYSGQLFRFARSYFHTNEDAEEIIQDVFLKLWKHKESIYSSDSLKSYLFQIAYRTIKETFIRKNREDKYKQRIALEYLKAESPELEQADYKLVLKAVDRLIETLPAQRQNIFILNKKEGLTISEIAVYLNITEKTVKNHLSLAMAQLRNEARQKGMAQLLFFFLFYKR